MAVACWFLIFVGVWWLPQMLMAAEEQQRESCSGSPKTCGNLNISDPFWLTNWETGRPCGSPDFEVACVSNTPVLWSSIPSGLGFEIIDISYEQDTLQVADRAKKYLLNASDSCEVRIWNTSAKLGVPFSISPANLNLILYNCTEEAAESAVKPRDTELVQTTVKCGNESKVLVRTGVRNDETSDYNGYATHGCIAALMPVLGTSSGEANATDYAQLINDGFLLTWGSPLARKFTRSIIFNQAQNRSAFIWKRSS